MKKKWIIGITVFIGVFLLVFFLYKLEIIPHMAYDNAHFNIPVYTSSIDKDNDGIDDQTDMLKSAREYLATKPKYKSQYYGSGYPDDEYGVCTDVVSFALLNSGYDIMNLLHEDVIQNRDAYQIELVDKNIDFRRVRNLQNYFQRHLISLTTDTSDFAAWQGGDIVVYETHIGLVSDKRNAKGIPFLIHHASPYQLRYEEDVLTNSKIVGHYRIS